MYIAKKYVETNKGSFKKGEIVPDEIAVRYLRYVDVVDGELLVETPVEVIVEVDGVDEEDVIEEETFEDVIEDIIEDAVEEAVDAFKKKSKKKK